MIVRAQGGIHDNPVSSQHQGCSHTDKISGVLTNMIPVLIRMGKGRRGEVGKSFQYSTQSWPCCTL